MTSKQVALVMCCCVSFLSTSLSYARTVYWEANFPKARQLYLNKQYKESEQLAKEIGKSLRGEYNAYYETVSVLNLLGNIYIETGYTDQARGYLLNADDYCTKTFMRKDVLCDDVRDALIKSNKSKQSKKSKWIKLDNQYQQSTIYCDTNSIRNENKKISAYLGLSKYSTGNDVIKLSKIIVDCKSSDNKIDVYGPSSLNDIVDMILSDMSIRSEVINIVCKNK